MPAAGTGQRFGQALPKQYADVSGRAVIEWALDPFLADARCAGVVVVLAEGDPLWPQVASRLPHAAVAAISTVTGGSERCRSVHNGLLALGGRAAGQDWVLVHDAARPCVAARDLDLLLESVGQHPVGGLLAAPAAETLKRAAEDRQIIETVDRCGLWRAQTPQMFRYGLLCDALGRSLAADRLPTDEAQALEWLGQRPLIVQGSSSNIKVTTADDLLVAGALLGARTRARATGAPE